MYEELILDTCALIWIAQGGAELSKDCLNAIEKAKQVYVSAISSFEISLKYRNGGIELPCDPERWYTNVLENHDINELAIDGKIAIASTKLPKIHKDPCDRFIIASAKLNNLAIVTKDKLFKRYEVSLIQ